MARARRTQHRARLLREVQFFRKHAGGAVGRATQVALALARAEQYGQAHGWTVEWQNDPDPDLSWASEKEREQIREVLGAILKDRKGKHLASLWGIVDPDDKYVRVIEAELMLEAMPGRHNPYSARAKFRHRRVRSPRRFARGSFRTVRAGGSRVVVGHLRGEKRRTRSGRRRQTVQAVLTPKANPMSKKEFEMMAALIADAQIRGENLHRTSGMIELAVAIGKWSNPRFDEERFLKRVAQLTTEKAPYRYVNRYKRNAASRYRANTHRQDFPVGARVELHPATSEWMQGDRYGVVVGYGRKREYRDRETGATTTRHPILVKLDKSGRTRRFHPDNVTVLAGNPRRNPALAIVGANPPMGKVVEIRYRRDQGAHPGYYRHAFRRGHEPNMVALNDGSLKIG